MSVVKVVYLKNAEARFGYECCHCHQHRIICSPTSENIQMVLSQMLFFLGGDGFHRQALIHFVSAFCLVAWWLF